MRRRHRHFNPAHAGADLVLDARYIDQSDNTAVSSWVDRSGNAYNASQATAANQPTFRTAQQGGNGGVDFDGSNDFMTGAYNPRGYPRTFHAVWHGDGGALGADYSGIIWQVPLLANPSGWIARWGNISGTTYVSGDATATNQTLSVAESSVFSATIASWSSNSSRTLSFARDGVTKTVNGNPPNAMSSGGVDGYKIGEFHSFSRGQNFNGRIFSIHVWGDEEISATLRKRCEHASAFSFKIACS